MVLLEFRMEQLDQEALAAFCIAQQVKECKGGNTQHIGAGFGLVRTKVIRRFRDDDGAAALGG